MTATWILVADSSRAKLFAVNKALEPLREIDSFSHPNGRARTQDLTTDREGRGYARGSMDHEVEPKRREAMTFAKELSDYLKSNAHDGQFQKLYIVASPAFLGLLRNKLDNGLSQKLAGVVNKDLTQLDPVKIRQHLPERL
ncbi:MAG: host attachment protein [Candidatus Competibacteraceae bacterium]|nr:host attachment protein [Candidatus Competibacteraceae bacterium]